jgi:diacylglycerol kinase family enzyme
MQKTVCCVLNFQMRKIGVIINVTAGSVTSEQLSSTIRAAFERQATHAEVRTVAASQLREAARALREEGFDYIVAGGGDGTASAVASELVGHDAALGVLPLGTLNHFARDLRLPLDLDEAVAVICSGQPTSVDVGEINGRFFINNSSLGLYPDQARIRQVWRAKIGRWPALVVASLVVLSRFPNLRVTAEFNGKRITRRCAMVLVSNNEYKFEPGNLTERERLDGGMLGVYLLRDVGRLGLLRVALNSLVINLEEVEEFESDHASEVIIHTRRRRVKVALDGEVYRFTSPLRYSMLPGSLRVIAPTR